MTLTKLPCWEHLDDAEYTRHVTEMVRSIEEEAWRRHRREGTVPRGVHWLLQQDPRSYPMRLHRSPRPRFHAATREARKLLEEGYRAFMVAYREAATRLREGGNPHGFPEGAFPPAQAFVAAWRREPLRSKLTVRVRAVGVCRRGPGRAPLSEGGPELLAVGGGRPRFLTSSSVSPAPKEGRQGGFGRSKVPSLSILGWHLCRAGADGRGGPVVLRIQPPTLVWHHPRQSHRSVSTPRPLPGACLRRGASCSQGKTRPESARGNACV